MEVAEAAPSDVGSWSPVYPLEELAIHMHLLPTSGSGKSRLLMWMDDGDTYSGPSDPDYTRTHLVTIPYMGAPTTEVFLANKATNLFCSGHTYRRDGVLAIIGGHAGQEYAGDSDLTFFNPFTQVYSRPSNGLMNAGRWYAGALTLGNGEILAISGTMTADKTSLNPLPQIWKTSGGWRNLTGAKRTIAYYPNLHIHPTSGRVFRSGPSPQTLYLDTAGTGRWYTGPLHLHQASGGREAGPVVQFEHGRYIAIGGGYGSSGLTGTAEVIDLTAGTPRWTYTNSMSVKHRNHNATMLPDGTVLVTGGNKSGFNSGKGGIRIPELWNPTSGAWRSLAPMKTIRVYHSTALLLPDGRVICAGGGRPPPDDMPTLNNANCEIFSPPYLFKGSRPTISSAPTQVGYGTKFTVATPDAGSISKVTMIRLGSVTHTLDMNQFYRSMTFTAGAGSLSVQIPSNGNHLPPGHYMLFILKSGIPSVARIMRVA